jgi:hypothetical protein
VSRELGSRRAFLSQARLIVDPDRHQKQARRSGPGATVGGVAGAIVIGVTARTGSAVAVVLSGPAGTPRFWARREIELIPPGLPAQPYHAAAGLDLAAAGQLIGQVAHDSEQAAAAGLRVLADLGPARASCAVAVVVKAVSVPDRLQDVLRSHAWMHAAEGMLYRQAVLAAAQECGWRAHAVELPLLPTAEHALAALGQAAGRPWRRAEKDAARAAITVLAQTADPS